ncbi:CHAT domain-containing protein [Okeania sp. SIO2B3]|uniref:CHAT domain-containing protein n=1 Tax=Okeania sp. SIO2B3 TaxID=2607784 RepID=UPI0025F6A9B5|nr:CHAT domain-containing protein [Okeania sp. SIO2B3]
MDTSPGKLSLDLESVFQLDFLIKVLVASADSKGNPKVIYPLLQANLEKLDDNFADVLRQWATARLSEAGSVEFVADSIWDFTKCLDDFQLGNKANNMEIVIAGYEMVLKVFTHESNPKKWAMIQSTIGTAYGNRIRGDKAENLENSIAAYLLALEVRTKKDFPIKWATTQYNLAITYSERIRGDKADNLEKAIAAYHLALEVRTQKDFPIDWAGTQNNLGNAYKNRIRGDKADNLEKAIAAYHLVLEVSTKKDFLMDWAKTQNNLAVTYTERIRGDKAENLEKAIAAYNLVLEVLTKKDFPMDWATIQNNLGEAYRIRGDKAENLEKAIAAYHLALEVRTQKDFPMDWAKTQNNLGNAYLDRIRGDKAENLENSIATYHLALEVLTKEDCPYYWAMTQNNLGNAYSDRIRGDKADNLEKAIAAYHLALSVRTLEGNPIDYLQTTDNLGYLHFQEGNWLLAIAAYEKVITAVELSRSWSQDDDRRQEILAEYMDVYQNIVQACVNTNQIEKALEYVERSRSKRLIDLMASNDLYFQGEIPAEVQEWLEKHDAIQQHINQLQEQQQGNSHTEGQELALATRGLAAMKARNESIAELEAQRQEIYKKIRSLDRVIAEGRQVEPLKFQKIQALIQEATTAILSFYTTTDNTYLFVVRQNGVKVYTYSELGIEKLQNWIINSWFNSYLLSRQEWEQKMPGFLEDVNRKLELEELCKSYLQDIEELILIPHLYLHFLPWSAMPVKESGDKKYLGDYFRIRTLASCQVLDFCTQRPEVTKVEYGVVDDTIQDRPLTSFAGKQVAKMYNVKDELRLQGDAATVSKYKALLGKVQGLLSTHHASANFKDNLKSGLVLADGEITLGQLLSPAWRFPDLEELFFGCCEVNLGVPKITDDIMTINTGFLCAGARSVISTLWSVAELSTVLLSIFYHQLRKEGKNRSLALQMAQQKLRQLTGKELKKKYKKALDRELEEALGEKLQEVYNQLKDVELRRNSCAKDSAEYQQWEKERMKLDGIYQRINYDKNEYLKEMCKLEHPFEHPVYWSAFICAGLS